MSTTCADLMKLASELHSDPGEANQRCSIGRSYYALYHTLQAWYASVGAGGAEIQGVGVHARFIYALKNPAVSLDAEARRLSKIGGAQLEALKNRRRIADYFLDEQLVPNEAEQQVSTVSLAISKFVMLPAN